MINNYTSVVNALDQFASHHLVVSRFKSSFFEQFDNFSTSENSFPILYAIPNQVDFETQTDVISFRVYCVDILQKDRSNEGTILNDTLLVLRDLTNWLRLDQYNSLNILNIPSATPVNNFLVDYTIGWYVDFEIEAQGVTSDCAIPFSDAFNITGHTLDITYVSPFLTCDTLSGCTLIQSLQNQINAISGGTDTTVTGFTYNDNNTLSIFDSTGGTFTTSINIMSGLTINGSLSATTYLGLPVDVRVTGGTYNVTSGIATFTNNTGGTFNVSGFYTGATATPADVVFFNQLTPTTSGVTFDPNTPALTNTLYTSTINASTWIYSGGTYLTYSAATTSNTPFYLNGTTVDAGSNKTAHISRSGSITIGGTGSTTDKFSVFTTAGTKTLVADNLGSVYNNGKGGLITNNAFGYQSLFNNTIGTNNSAFGYRAMLLNLSGNSNSAFGYETLLNNIDGNYNTAIGYNSMRTNSTGIANTSTGFQSLYSNTTGNYNTSNGFTALYNNTTANYNTAIGYNSMYSNTTGTTNVALGAFSLYSNVGNNNNTAIGTNALRLSNGGYDNTALGFQALYSNTVGYSNTALGKDTLFSNTSGATNVAIGDRTLFSNTSGSYNVGIGYRSLYDNTTGSYNVSNGFESLRFNTIGSANIALGYKSMQLNTIGSNNVAVGYETLLSSTGTSSSVAVGHRALRSLTTGANNTALGFEALFTNVSGASNTAVGYQSLYFNTSTGNSALGKFASYNNTTGTNNTAIGFEASFTNTTGSTNTAVGYQSLFFNTAGGNSALGRYASYNNTTGTLNTAIGLEALFTNTIGSNNTALGYRAGFSNTTGSNNTSIGYQSLYNNISGASNTAIGHQSSYSNISGILNTAIGFQSLYSNTVGSNNTALGYYSLLANTSGVTNTAIGLEASRNNTSGNNNVAIGGGAAYTNTIGIGNTAIGFQSQFFNFSGSYLTSLGYRSLRANTTGVSNTAIGTESLVANTTGSYNTTNGFNSLWANITGNYNTANGYQSLFNNTTGDSNVGVGYQTLYNASGTTNTAIGYRAGYQLTTGSYNTIIGANVVVDSGLSNSLVLSDGNGIVKLSGDSAHKLWIPTAPNTGTTSDSLLVRTSAGEIRTIATSSISGSSSSTTFTGGTVTGATNFTNQVQVGNTGVEGSGINVNNITFNSSFKVSDIDGTNIAQTILHKHSTTAEPLIVGARSNSDNTGHSAVTNNMNTFTIYGAGWNSSAYNINGQISIATDDTGTLSSTSSPGKISLYTTPNGSIWPELAVNVDSNKGMRVYGGITGSSITATTSDTVYVPDLIVLTNKYIKSDVGGSQIDLSSNAIGLSTDNGIYDTGSLYLDETSFNAYVPTSSVGISSTQGYLLNTNMVGIGLNSVGGAALSNISIQNNISGTTSTPHGINGSGVFINSSSSVFLSGVSKSVIIGGSSLTATTSNTVYTSALNIKSIGSGTSITNLGIDINGNVVSGSTQASITGSAILDFNFSGGSEGDMTSVVVSNSNITSTSFVIYNVVPSTDHESIEDALLDGLVFTTSDIVNGVSFKINAIAGNNTWGRYNVNYKILN